MSLLRTLSAVVLGAALAAPVRAQSQDTPKHFPVEVLLGTQMAARTAAVGQLGASPLGLAFHAGGMLSPRGAALAGLDLPLDYSLIGTGFRGRLDADAIIKANLGGVNTLVPVTFDQIYNLNLPVSSRVYVGGGIGPYFGDKTRFGGKLIAGAEFNRFGLEGNIHFAGTGDTLFTVQARIGL